jgi:cation transport ATPase
MHDVHRDSLLAKKKKKKKPITGGAVVRSHDHGHDHDHDHDDHDHDLAHGHKHDHDDEAYEAHDEDLHIYEHRWEKEGGMIDRAWNHAHEHAHSFYHVHFHSHEPEHTSLVHKIFKDPARDWFAVFLMGLLIVTGYMQWLPGHLSTGMLVCAAIIGIFPILKNAIFETIANRRPNLELVLGVLLMGGLVMGRFLETSIVAFCVLVGSFLKLNFSWKRD